MSFTKPLRFTVRKINEFGLEYFNRPVFIPNTWYKYKVLKSLLNVVASAGKGEIEFRGEQPGIPWYRIFNFGITDKHLAK
jgi:hypothetical protein